MGYVPVVVRKNYDHSYNVMTDPGQGISCNPGKEFHVGVDIWPSLCDSIWMLDYYA